MQQVSRAAGAALPLGPGRLQRAQHRDGRGHQVRARGAQEALHVGYGDNDDNDDDDEDDDDDEEEEDEDDDDDDDDDDEEEDGDDGEGGDYLSDTQVYELF